MSRIEPMTSHMIDKHCTSELYHQLSPITLTLPPMMYKGLWLTQSGPLCFLTICKLLFLPGVSTVSSELPFLFKHQTYCFCRAFLLSPFSQNVLDPLFHCCLLNSADISSTPTSLERPFLSPTQFWSPSVTFCHSAYHNLQGFCFLPVRSSQWRLLLSTLYPQFLNQTETRRI